MKCLCPLLYPSTTVPPAHLLPCAGILRFEPFSWSEDETRVAYVAEEPAPASRCSDATLSLCPLSVPSHSVPSACAPLSVPCSGLSSFRGALVERGRDESGLPSREEPAPKPRTFRQTRSGPFWLRFRPRPGAPGALTALRLWQCPFPRRVQQRRVPLRERGRGKGSGRATGGSSTQARGGRCCSFSRPPSECTGPPIFIFPSLCFLSFHIFCFFCAS